MKFKWTDERKKAALVGLEGGTNYGTEWADDGSFSTGAHHLGFCYEGHFEKETVIIDYYLDRARGIRSGRNVWICEYCREVFKGGRDGSRPQSCSDTSCKSEQFSAKYPLNRVHKGVYRYYTGNDPWTKDANMGLKSDAQSQMRK